MIALDELRDAAAKAFPSGRLTPPRTEGWETIIEMGWLGIELAERDGGLELGREASAAVHYEAGRSLASAPLAVALASLKAVAASPMLADRANWIERLTTGGFVSQPLFPHSVKLANDGMLSGTVSGVPEADMASHVLLQTEGRCDLVPLGDGAVTVIERTTWDPSRKFFDVHLDRYALNPDLVVALDEDALKIREMLSDSLLMAVAADSLGGANAVFTMTVDYLKTRHQFGRPLALFQALKHRVADLKVRLEAADALYWARAKDSSNLTEIGGLKALCSRAYRDVVEEAIQLHGGIGLTGEYPCHLFFKRAMLNCQIGGDADQWDGQVGRELLAL